MQLDFDFLMIKPKFRTITGQVNVLKSAYFPEGRNYRGRILTKN